MSTPAPTTSAAPMTTAVANPHAVADHRVRPDRDVAAEVARHADHRRRVHPGAAAGRRGESAAAARAAIPAACRRRFGPRRRPGDSASSGVTSTTPACDDVNIVAYLAVPRKLRSRDDARSSGATPLTTVDAIADERPPTTSAIAAAVRTNPPSPPVLCCRTSPGSLRRRLRRRTRHACRSRRRALRRRCGFLRLELGGRRCLETRHHAIGDVEVLVGRDDDRRARARCPESSHSRLRRGCRRAPSSRHP